MPIYLNIDHAPGRSVYIMLQHPQTDLWNFTDSQFDAVSLFNVDDHTAFTTETVSATGQYNLEIYFPYDGTFNVYAYQAISPTGADPTQDKKVGAVQITMKDGYEVNSYTITTQIEALSLVAQTAADGGFTAQDRARLRNCEAQSRRTNKAK